MKTKEFEKIIAEELKVLGFSKKKYFFVKQLDELTIGSIGFFISSYQTPGTIYVNPVVGIHNKKIEEIYCMLTGADTIKTCRGTISISIGYLIPPDYRYKEWRIFDNDNKNPTITDLIENITAFGIPFMKHYKAPGEMLKCLEERKYIVDASYHLPIMYYVLGNKEQALNYIEINKNKKKDRQYLEFAVKFRDFVIYTSENGMGSII